MKKQDEELSLEERIKAAEDKVDECRKPYDEAVEELAALVKLKKKERDKMLLDAVSTSRRSFDEIMEFIQSDPEDDEWY
ncbi:MAG: hypothetical protein LIO96_14740 [Lachnospiraceae bacterium]|nr:hypothetical protein [Lachnospiraceae bacterium]